MTFLEGGTHKEQIKHVERIMKDGKLDMQEHQVIEEIRKVISSIITIDTKLEDLQKESSQLTIQFAKARTWGGNNQYKEIKAEHDIQLAQILNVELKDATKLLDDLLKLRNMIKIQIEVDKS